MPDFNLTDTDSTVLSDAAVSIEGYIDGLRTIYKTVESSVMPSLIPCWQGRAKENFEQKYAMFTLELSSLISGYEELNEQLKRAGAAYAKADDSVLQITAGLPK